MVKGLGYLLEVKDLKKSFGGIQALRGVSLNVRMGEIVGVIGPNGSGKTTLFNLIMGVYKQDSGEIYFEGREISKLKTYQRVSLGIARSFQVPRNLTTPAVENIGLHLLPNSLRALMYRSGIRAESVRIGATVGLENELWRLPSELTIGDLRRLQLAEVIAKEPKLALLDEIFAGLTPEEAGYLCKTITRLKKDKYVTFILIDHNIRYIKDIVARFFVLDRGVKIAEGQIEEILSNQDVIKAYMGESELWPFLK